MDQEQISSLYLRFGPLIYRRCLKLLRDPASARDATQEVFVRALCHAERLTQDREGLPWLYQVATNYCLNHIRNARHIEFREPQDLPEPALQQGCEEWLEARQVVLSLLDQFDQKTQEIAIYAFMDGMTQEEIADTVGLSRKTVGKKLGIISKKIEEMTAKDLSS
jgi:RNA polymerase sigma-70 factor, ECF subfamily